MKNIKILHLAKDEKFINSANWQFEKIFPAQNEFRIYIKDKNEPLKYVEKRKNVIVFEQTQQSQITHNIEYYDLVVLHGLDEVQSTAVLNASPKVKFLWLFFGAEIYSNIKAPGNENLGALSKKLVLRKRVLDSLKELIKPIYFWGRGSMATNLKIIKAAKKIKYFGILYREEYELLLDRKILNPNSSLIKFTYYPIEFIFKDVENITIGSNSILIGNSSSVSNNHLEAFELLRTRNIGNRKLIVPLSYGDDKYRNKIIKKGKQLFGQNFEPLTTFMSLAEYNNKLSECGIVIMNHYRQQAVGTVLAMVWMGAKVYLSNQNTLYHYLKRINISVYSIEEDINKEDFFLPLDSEAIEKNKRILNIELSQKNNLLTLKNNIENIFK